MNSKSRPITIAVVCAHKIWNVPPLINAPKVFSLQKWRTIVIGFADSDLPPREMLADGAHIQRLTLRTRAIPFAVIRKVAATVEFLLRARAEVKRVKPDILIAVNEPASLLLRLCGTVSLKIAWPLEYPEFESHALPERIIHRISSGSWAKADWLIAPTMFRLALSIGLVPAILNRRCFVVHNAPMLTEKSEATSSAKAFEAIEWIKAQRGVGRLSVLYAGAVGNRYGINRLIEAISDSPDVSLLILGAKHDLAEMEVNQALVDSNAHSAIKWIDEIPYRELASVIRFADAGFVHYIGDTVNTRFSAPGKLYEYLRAGLAIITDSECCIAGELKAAKVGFFFDRPATCASIRLALNELVADRRRLDKIRSASVELYEEQFCLEHQLRPILTAIKHHFHNQS